ncbi:hypothetical protein KY290_000955 [Solanum tuberosum]|uniref:Signal recognition particle subunit SRP72 n=1 Tax=Solanum tuberosum TaxID=4113 RepID=A0ABQ7WKR8_SOLTU|nr:hypothetical protein KY290_000955 [Solanum tuberosum]
MEENLADDDVEIELVPIAVQIAYVQQILGNTQEAVASYTDLVKRNLADESSLAVAVNNLIALKGPKDVSDGLRKLDELIEKSDEPEKFQLARGLDLKLSQKQREAIYTNRVLLLLHSNKMDQKQGDPLIDIQLLLLENLLAKIPDIQHKPATIATIVSLKERAGDTDGADAVFDSAIKWWSNAMTEDNKLNTIMQEAANFKLRHGRKEEAARLYGQLVKSHESKGFDPANPGSPPDPERWLPKRERSSYRPKRKDKRAAQIRGSQGAVAKEAASSSDTKSNQPANPKGASQNAVQSKASSKSSRKKSRK